MGRRRRQSIKQSEEVSIKRRQVVGEIEKGGGFEGDKKKMEEERDKKMWEEDRYEGGRGMASCKEEGEDMGRI